MPGDVLTPTNAEPLPITLRVMVHLDTVESQVHGPDLRDTGSGMQGNLRPLARSDSPERGLEAALGT